MPAPLDAAEILVVPARDAPAPAGRRTVPGLAPGPGVRQTTLQTTMRSEMTRWKTARSQAVLLSVAPDTLAEAPFAA
jgi:hypothetical protein